MNRILQFLFFFCLPSSILGADYVPMIRERHWAVTSEKFELAMQRFRTETQGAKSAVILSHGFFLNSQFLDLDQDRSLAEYLAREGFDVWNLSLRGTGRSLKPLKNPPSTWSLDDIIERDVEAVIAYVRKESRSPKVGWVGFDKGGLIAYGYVQRRGNPPISALVTLGAPVTFTDPAQEPMKRLLRLQENPTLKRAFLYLNGPFLGRILIPLVPKIESLFYNPRNMDDQSKRRLLEDGLTGINPGVLDQLLLMIKRGEFVTAQGDFSYRKNLRRIRLPLLLIGGEKDPLAPPDALRVILRSVGSEDRRLRIFGPGSKDSAAYGHFDLILGEKARQEVFPFIARWLKKRDGR